MDNVDSGVLSRIKKALQLAQHEGTGEPEAKAAMRHAHKLMQGLNITTADVMAQESSESKADRAGKSEVAVCWRNEGSHDACRMSCLLSFNSTADGLDSTCWDLDESGH